MLIRTVGAPLVWVSWIATASPAATLKPWAAFVSLLVTVALTLETAIEVVRAVADPFLIMVNVRVSAMAPEVIVPATWSALKVHADAMILATAPSTALFVPPFNPAKTADVDAEFANWAINIWGGPAVPATP
jgi:hypothetical protein